MTTVDVTDSGVSAVSSSDRNARARLLSIQAAARRQPAFQRLAVISRILLAAGFVPTALIKVAGQRFTTIPIDHPVGFFFEAMYRSGAYWNFIGWVQLIAGVLILIPRTATLGAVLFYPVILNIFVITTSMGFSGTPVLTAGMLLAATFLLCWDYDKLEAILFGEVRREDRWGGPGTMLERVAFAVGGAAVLAFFLGTRGFAPREVMVAAMPVGGAAAVVVAFAWFRAWRAGR